MKRVRRGTVIVLVLAQCLSLAADDFAWDLVSALAGGEPRKVDQVLSAHADKMTAAEKRLAYSFVLDYTRGETTLKVMELLRKYGIHAIQYDLFNAINRSHTNRVIDVILNDGIRPNGEILLLAAEEQRWDLVKAFIEMGADANYKYPADKSYADGMTALIYAAKNNNLEMVRFLVEFGADVNLRTSDGGTAASIAYENGLVDIYNYLKDHGAVDFVETPAAEGSSGAGLADSGLSSGGLSLTGLGISNLIESGSPLFRDGTYRLSGSTAEITLTGGGSGYLSYKNSRGTAGTGIFMVTGSTLALTTEGITFTYRVDTTGSFSGNGETWVRIGN
jgi:hypothetical protein